MDCLFFFFLLLIDWSPQISVNTFECVSCVLNLITTSIFNMFALDHEGFLPQTSVLNYCYDSLCGLQRLTFIG